MKIVPSNALFAPNCCFLCQEHPRVECDMVDTGFSWYPTGMTALDGIKYVCPDCLHEMARLYGYEHTTKKEEAEAYVEALRVSLRELEAAFSKVGVETNHFRQYLPAEPVSSAPVRKARSGTRA